MAEQVDVAEEKFNAIFESIDWALIISEEDAKIKIINRILNDVLGWDLTKHISFEPNVGGDFADYAFRLNESYAIALEAKKIGGIKINTANLSVPGHYKINGSVLREASKHVDQVFKYAAGLGASIAAITDGDCWIVFKPFHEGQPYRDREAIVFPTMEAVRHSFSDFFELLSLESINNRTFAKRFDALYNKRTQLTRKMYQGLSNSDIRLGEKSELSYDIDRLFAVFFRKLTGDDDEDMLVECFVDTKESRFADYALEKITSQVLGTVQNRVSDIGDSLADVVEAAVDRDEGETVFIVGPTGAGKSTFIKRFFSKSLKLSTRERLIVSRINLLDHTASEDTLSHWITEQLIASIESQLFKGGMPSWDDLRGLYFDEYQKRSHGVDALIYARNKELFYDKFSSVIEKLVHDNREDYLRRLVRNIVKNRSKLPVFVVDNTDEFPIYVKEIIFQYFHSLKRFSGHALLIFPITDKSAWAFSRTEIANIYASKSFFLPTPPPREVFRKRIDFIKSKVEEGLAEEGRGSDGTYFTKKGIKVSLPDLGKFAGVIESLFVEHEILSKIIGDLANYNIRKTLEISNKIVTSPTLDVDTLVKSYVLGELHIPSMERILYALFRGKYEHFRRDVDPNIFPLFDELSEIRHSPLLWLRVLALLESFEAGARSLEERYISFGSLLGYFEAIGGDEMAVTKICEELIASDLVEVFDPSRKSVGGGQKLALAPKGKAHLNFALNDKAFVSELALTCPLVDEVISKELAKAYGRAGSEKSRMDGVRSVFVQYLIRRDAEFFVQGTTDASYSCQAEIFPRLTQVGGLGQKVMLENIEIDKDEVFEGSVEFYNRQKGFGFVLVKKFGMSAHLGSGVVAVSDDPQLFDGADINVKLELRDKGLKVTEIVPSEDQTISSLSVVVSRAFPDRGYAFVIDGNSNEAFLHYSVLPDDEEDLVTEGLALVVAISIDREGRRRVTKVESVQMS